MKVKLTFASALIAMASVAQAATLVVSNVATGYGDADALLQNVNGSLMSGGVAHLGVFSSAPSGDLSLIGTTIANFTILATGIPGALSETWGAAVPGYVESAAANLGSVTTGSPFLGQALYLFVGNSGNLGASNAWALVQVNTIKNDVPFNNTYTAQPFGLTPVIGNIGSANAISPGDGLPETYTTLQLEAVPEPSAILLGAIGVLGLLRRRRI